MIKLFYFFISLFCISIFLNCDSPDIRIKLINETKRTVICRINIGDKNKMIIPSCSEFPEWKKDKDMFLIDSTRIPTLGIWDSLLKNDPLIIYFYDSAKFESYCKGQIPIDSTFKKYYFRKDELIKNNWTIVIKE